MIAVTKGKVQLLGNSDSIDEGTFPNRECSRTRLPDSITRLDRRAIFNARYYFALTSFDIFELFASKEFLFFDSSFPKYVMRSMPLDTWTLTTYTLIWTTSGFFLKICDFSCLGHRCQFHFGFKSGNVWKISNTRINTWYDTRSQLGTREATKE